MPKRRRRREQATTDRRPPEERLEALVRERNRERQVRILGRIRHDLDASADPAPWIAAARTLSERLIISERMLYYFVEIFIESVIFDASKGDEQLAAIRDEMNAIERAHGLAEDESWYIDEAPAEWRELNDAWDCRADAVCVEYLRAHGHADIARVFEARRDEFSDMGNAGRLELLGDDDLVD